MLDKASRQGIVILSKVVTIFLFAILLISAIFLPRIVGVYLNAFHTDIFSDKVVIIIEIILYFCIAMGIVASCGLYLLLRNVENNLVFTQSSINKIAFISVLCFLEGIAFIMLGKFFIISFVVAFIAFLLGIVVLVVRNVIAEATKIKNENDLTV